MVNLCAIVIVVLPFDISSNVFCIYSSFSLSKADVASSSNRIFGFFNIARVIAILCFYPPESCYPPGPTKVSNFEGSYYIKEYILAYFVASINSSSVASGFATNKLSFIDVANKTGSWPTYPIYSLSHLILHSLMSTPSILSAPLSTS